MTPRGALSRPAPGVSAVPSAPGALDLDALSALEARLAAAALTPGEIAEALCIALGFGCELTAAARGLSARTVRERRRRVRRKLARVA